MRDISEELSGEYATSGCSSCEIWRSLNVKCTVIIKLFNVTVITIFKENKHIFYSILTLYLKKMIYQKVIYFCIEFVKISK